MKQLILNSKLPSVNLPSILPWLGYRSHLENLATLPALKPLCLAGKLPVVTVPLLPFKALVSAQKLLPVALLSNLPRLGYRSRLETVTALSALRPLRLTGRLSVIVIPVFPVGIDDPQALKDSLGDFILGADGANLWGAPN